MDKAADQALPDSRKGAVPRAWSGPLIVLGAVACSLATFLATTELRVLSPTDDRLFPLLIANGVLVSVLLVMVVLKLRRLYKVWRRGEAAARLHARVVTVFSVISLVPAVTLAIAAG